MKSRIQYLLETNKVGFIIGCVIFGVLFIYFLFLTINAFTGGSIAGQKSEEYYIGECKYGKITYYGEVNEEGRPAGEGKFSVSDGDRVIDIVGTVSDSSIEVDTMSVTDYENHYNTIITGEPQSANMENINGATIRHEDINGNYGMWAGTITNKQLSEFGEAYYMIHENDIGYCRIGNFIDGKLTTIVYTEDVVISEIPPEESLESEIEE